jgi:hypothetical protein
MTDWKAPSGLREANPQARASASGSASWSASRWWWLHRHLHVPVVVWIVASVLGGAAIGQALEPDGTTEVPAPAEVVAEPIVAARCADAATEADVDGPSYVAESGELPAGDADRLGARLNGDCD